MSAITIKEEEKKIVMKKIKKNSRKIPDTVTI